MIKKILSMLMIAAVAVMAVSCADEQEKKCKEIADALQQQDFTKVAEVCDGLYSQLPDCNIKTLGDMTLSYITLAAVGITQNDTEGTAEAMRRAVGCYDEAMKKDATKAQEMWQKIAGEKTPEGMSINPTEVIDVFRTSLASFDAQVVPSVDTDSITPSEEIALEETAAVAQD